MKDFPDEVVAMAGVKGPLKLHDILFVARKSNRIASLQVVRADRVMGEDHVRSAARHARRAMVEGRNQAETVDVEFLRYLAGERQIKHALAKMGLPEVAEAGVVVALGEKRQDALAHFIDTLGLREDDALLLPDPKQLPHFVTPAALAATPVEKHFDLVLERVAEVDMLK